MATHFRILAMRTPWWWWWFSHQVMSDFVTPRTVTCQASPSMGFPREEYWNGLPFPSPGDVPHPGIKPISPALQADSLPMSYLGTPCLFIFLLSSKNIGNYGIFFKLCLDSTLNQIKRHACFKKIFRSISMQKKRSSHIIPHKKTENYLSKLGP